MDLLESDVSAIQPLSSSPASPSFLRHHNPTFSPSFVCHEERSASFLQAQTSTLSASLPDLSEVHSSRTFVKHVPVTRSKSNIGAKFKSKCKSFKTKLRPSLGRKSSLPNLGDVAGLEKWKLRGGGGDVAGFNESLEIPEVSEANGINEITQNTQIEITQQDLKETTLKLKKSRRLSTRNSCMDECPHVNPDDANDGQEDIEDVVIEEDVTINEELVRKAANHWLKENEAKSVQISHFFKLSLTIVSGTNLAPMDRSGTSDPYVKVFQQCGQTKNHTLRTKEINNCKEIYQTDVIKTDLNPFWDEACVIHITTKDHLILQVWDWNLAESHKYMGTVKLDFGKLEEYAKKLEVSLPIEEQDGQVVRSRFKLDSGLGSLQIGVELSPVSKEQFEFRTNIRRVKWSGVVRVVLIQARGLLAIDADVSCDPYCRLTVGKEVQTSKVLAGTLNPKWKEAFDINWIADEQSEVLPDLYLDLFSKKEEDFIGRVKVNLKELLMDKSYKLWAPVKYGSGQLNFILTVSGITAPIDPALRWQPVVKEEKLNERFNLRRTFQQIEDVGHISVKVLKARGLNTARGFTPNPFCVVELTNIRLQTHTEFKTLEPVWQKSFSFDINDINEVLEVTVFHEDTTSMSGLRRNWFLGKISVPLLRIQSGERKWFTLKKEHLRKKAKGTNPQVLLEINLHWNPVRAIVRTFQPKIEKYEAKLEEHGIGRTMENIRRIKVAFASFSGGMEPEKLIKDMFGILKWENKIKSAIAYIVFVLGVLFFEPWMISFGLVLPFFHNIFLLTVTGARGAFLWEDADEDEVEEAQPTKAAGTTFNMMDMNKKYQEIITMVGGIMEQVAHAMEVIHNMFNFSIPFLSCLGLVVMTILTLVLYFVPLRVLIIFIGTHTFMKTLIQPWLESRCEIVDYLSRVPNKEQLVGYKEIKDPFIDVETLEKINKKAAEDKKII